MQSTSLRTSTNRTRQARKRRVRRYKCVAIHHTLDNAGNLTQEKVGATGTVGNNLAYDGLNRLTGVKDLNNAMIAAYTVDATGNRLSKQAGASTPVAYTYPLQSHQLIAVGTGAATTMRGYDAAGDTTAIGTGASAQGFVYNDTGRMNQFNLGGTSKMQYKVNALGQRVQKLNPANALLTQYTVYDESGHILGDYDNTPSTYARIRELIWMDGMPVGVLNGSAGTLAYIEPDQLGTPRVAIDATSNAVVWNWSPLNDPFGETQPTGSLTLNLRLPGQVWDAESGLSYNYFRDYDPSTGRYAESDPIGLRGGISTYGYVGGNPLSFSDPYGLDFLGKCLAQQYLDKYGKGAWDQIRADRDSTQPVVPGTDSEAMRNAEHYLSSYDSVQQNSYSWGVRLGLTVGYQATKFWANVGDYWGVMKSPWGYSVPTNNELKAGIEGANDALFGNSAKSSCGCGGQ